MQYDELKDYIRSVPDFPKPGINFYDITTMFQKPRGLELALDGMQRFAETKSPTLVVGIESRGFIFGAALADRLGIGFVPARKSGKLPYKTIRESYDLEYGTAQLEMHIDSVTEGDKVLIIDDLFATGGTARAAATLVERLGGEVVGISAVIGLVFLPFEEKLAPYDLNYLVAYDSE